MSCLKPFVTWWTSTSTVRISPWTSSCRISLANPPSRSVGCYLKHVLFQAFWSFCHLWFQVLAQSCHFDFELNNVNQTIPSVSQLVSVFIALGSHAHREISLAQIFLHLTVLNIEYGLIGFYFAIMQHFHFQSGQKKKSVTAQCYILIIWIKFKCAAIDTFLCYQEHNIPWSYFTPKSKNIEIIWITYIFRHQTLLYII